MFFSGYVEVNLLLHLSYQFSYHLCIVIHSYIPHSFPSFKCSVSTSNGCGKSWGWVGDLCNLFFGVCFICLLGLMDLPLRYSQPLDFSLFPWSRQDQCSVGNCAHVLAYSSVAPFQATLVHLLFSSISDLVSSIFLLPILYFLLCRNFLFFTFSSIYCPIQKLTQTCSMHVHIYDTSDSSIK